MGCDCCGLWVGEKCIAPYAYRKATCGQGIGLKITQPKKKRKKIVKSKKRKKK